MSVSSFPRLIHARTWQETVAEGIRQLEIDYDPSFGILWLRMRHPERACFTPELMADMRAVQLRLKELFGGLRDPRDLPFQCLAWASDAPRVWSLGGDLATFCHFIRTRDRAGLLRYAELAVEILHDNYRSLDLPILTAALVEGDALGGGFEAILTDDLVVAERDAKFGLPEILFNMFPGMGASSLLIRKLGSAAATRLILSGESWTAEQAHHAGAVSLIADPGTARTTLLRYLDTYRARLPGEIALHQARRRAEGLSLDEMLDVVRIWTDLTLGLGEDSLRRMQALARVQERRAAQGG